MRQQTWFITGCSSGFGLAIARIAMNNGHHVIGTSRSPKPDLASEFALHGGRLIQFDVTSPDSGTVLAALDAETPIDVLVNNAGYALLGPVESFTDDQVRGLIETLYLGPMRLVRAVVPGMRRRMGGRVDGGGVIVSISSGAGVEGRDGMGAYGPAKSAMDNAMRVLGKEMAPFGVRVLTVQLGAFDTGFANGDMFLELDQDTTETYRGSMVEKVMTSLSGKNFQPDGDHVKAAQVIYETVVGEGVGKDWEKERVLPLGKDMIPRIEQTIKGWQETLRVFGEICTSVSKAPVGK